MFGHGAASQMLDVIAAHKMAARQPYTTTRFGLAVTHFCMTGAQFGLAGTQFCLAVAQFGLTVTDFRLAVAHFCLAGAQFRLAMAQPLRRAMGTG